jgi:NADH:ubiquinone oxidoreductase subunit E
MLNLNVCIGSSCHIKGSYNIIQTFQQLIEKHSLHGKIEFKAVFCMKQCHNKGVSVTVGNTAYSVLPENAESFFLGTVFPQC